MACLFIFNITILGRLRKAHNTKQLVFLSLMVERSFTG